MLSSYTSPSEIPLVLEASDARWLSEEMSFLAELYRSKAESSERQFGGDNNAALASFLETQSKWYTAVGRVAAGAPARLSSERSRPSVGSTGNPGASHIVPGRLISVTISRTASRSPSNSEASSALVADNTSYPPVKDEPKCLLARISSSTIRIAVMMRSKARGCRSCCDQTKSKKPYALRLRSARVRG
jgi:hypothetical protein